MSIRIKQWSIAYWQWAGFVKRLLASLASVASLIALTGSGHPQRNGSNARLMDLFEIGLPPADVAVLLDASLSMRNHRYGEVRQAIVEFTSSLTSKETLSLRIFGDIAGASLEDQADKVSGNVAKHLPAEPLFQYTDLGLAILKGLDFLERDGASQAQVMFLITDGRHDPPPGTDFAGNFRVDPNWQSLRRRAHELCQSRKITVFGFGLGNLTDVSVLQEVFPTTNVELVIGDAGQVIATLRRLREMLRATQLQNAVKTELNDGGVMVQTGRSSIETHDAEFNETVTIRNGYRHLPIVIDRVYLAIDPQSNREIELIMDDPWNGRLELAPGQEWTGRIAGALQADLPGLIIGRRERSYRAGLRVAVAGHFKHRAEIAKLGLDRSDLVFSGQPMRVEFRARYGIPYWIIACALLAGSGLALALVRRRKLTTARAAAYEKRFSERRRITGEIRIWSTDQHEPDHIGLDLANFDRERLWLITGPDGMPEIVAMDDREPAIVAILDNRISGARPGDAESGRVEFSIEATPGHSLAYESDGGFRAAARLTLCDRDLIVIDGRWNLHYSNHRLRTRAEVESAQGA